MNLGRQAMGLYKVAGIDAKFMIFVVGAGFGLCGAYCTHILASSPDIRIDVSKPITLRDNQAEGERYYKHSIREHSRVLSRNGELSTNVWLNNFFGATNRYKSSESKL